MRILYRLGLLSLLLSVVLAVAERDDYPKPEQSQNWLYVSESPEVDHGQMGFLTSEYSKAKTFFPFKFDSLIVERSENELIPVHPVSGGYYIEYARPLYLSSIPKRFKRVSQIDLASLKAVRLEYPMMYPTSSMPDRYGLVELKETLLNNQRALRQYRLIIVIGVLSIVLIVIVVFYQFWLKRKFNG